MALRRGECRLGIQYAQPHLQHIVLTDAAHLALCLCHFVEFFRILQVLLGNVHVLVCQQQIEIEADGLHRHLLRFRQEGCLRLFVSDGFDATIPLHGVYAKEWLAQREGYGHAHELVPASACVATHLPHPIQR